MAGQDVPRREETEMEEDEDKDRGSSSSSDSEDDDDYDRRRRRRVRCRVVVDLVKYPLSSQGLVVQSLVSLTSLLVVKILTVLVRTISDSQVFLLKKCE